MSGDGWVTEFQSQGRSVDRGPFSRLRRRSRHRNGRRNVVDDPCSIPETGPLPRGRERNFECPVGGAGVPTIQVRWPCKGQRSRRTRAPADDVGTRHQGQSSRQRPTAHQIGGPGISVDPPSQWDSPNRSRIPWGPVGPGPLDPPTVAVPTLTSVVRSYGEYLRTTVSQVQ